MTISTGQLIRGLIALALVVGLVGFVVVRSVRKADDPARMIFKWVLTALTLGVLFGVVGRLVGQGGYGGAFLGIPATAGCGLVLAAIWRHDLAALVAKPFASLYDGGDVPPEPKPAYSVAMARQKQGRYLEAVAEIRRQLDRFPTDVEGHLLLAQIQAENLQDLQGAEITIQNFCAQPGHAPQNIVFALYSMADWHLKIGQDREAARRELEKVIELLPDTEFALGAAQRIAHLGSLDMVLAPHERKKFAVTEGDQHLGLRRGQEGLTAPEVDPKRAAAEYVKHLEQHPLDMDAREKLAVIYVDHYQRLDLATGELEQMIALPNQPARLVVHWLNLLADLQIRSGADYETVKQTLERIIERDPEAAAAELARHRLALLKLELKANEQKRAVKLGTYEQNIGLKRAGAGSVPPAKRAAG